MTRRLAVLVLLLIGCAGFAHASSRYDPRLRFRTISTPRFDIHFHQGEEAQARRLAVLAESIAARLDPTLGRPDGRVQVVLVDQNDQPNGWATPVPFNLIEITAAAPSAGSQIGNTDDWLATVFAHEYTHIVHLSRKGGWIGGLRRVFGRHPVLFPNVFLPQWQIEGLATFEESALAGHGRIHAGDFRAIVQHAADRSVFEPLDRVNGGLVDWPSGTAPYVYGAYFNEFLARRYGEEALRRLADQTARTLPYLGPRAYRSVFGRSLGDLWREYEEEVAGGADTREPDAIRLTHHGFDVRTPRYSRGGRLFYAVTDPHGFPSLRELMPDGRSREVARNYLGNRISVAGSLIVYDQLDVIRNVGVQSDLYVTSPDGGDGWRLTYGARAADPDVSPEGRTVVCTIQAADRRELATVALPAPGVAAAAPVALVSEPDTYFASPRWSPDGRLIAAERRRRGSLPVIVVLDAETGRVVHEISAGPESRHASPAWLPDGRLLFTSDYGGEGFRIYRATLPSLSLERLDGTGPDARDPEVSPDGGRLVFSGYTIDGYDLFSVDAASARWEPFAASVPPASRERAQTEISTAPVSSYSPWRTIAPRFWTPVLESDDDELVAGVATAGADALGRHLYAADVGWSTRARPDWTVAYTYDRWWPALFVNAANDADPFREGEIRTLEVNAGVQLPFRRIRWSQSILAALHASTDEVDCATCEEPFAATLRRRAIRAGWRIDAARTYGYSISTEDGWRLRTTAELTRDALGADGDATAVIVDARGYLPVVPRHGVLAARVAAATSRGDDEARRLFSAGGSGPAPVGFDFDSDAIGLLRGFESGSLFGQHAAVINVDYRFPLAWIERGAGTFPLFLRSIHGAVFMDLGHAWDERFDWSDVSLSAGAEVSTDAVLGYVLPVTFTMGAAWRDHGLRNSRDVVVFGRIGRAF